MGYKVSDLAIEAIKSLKSESNEEVKLQSKEELGLALSLTYMVAGFDKGQDKELKVLQEKI